MGPKAAVRAAWSMDCRSGWEAAGEEAREGACVLAAVAAGGTDAAGGTQAGVGKEAAACWEVAVVVKSIWLTLGSFKRSAQDAVDLLGFVRTSTLFFCGGRFSACLIWAMPNSC